MRRGNEYTLFLSLLILGISASNFFSCLGFVQAKNDNPPSRGRASEALQTATQEEARNYVEGEVIIKYKKDKIDLQSTDGKKEADNFIASRSLEKKEDLKEENISVLRIKGSTVKEKIEELKGNSNIEYAQPNYIYETSAISTNDTSKDLLWGLDNTGQTVNGVTGTADADIDAPEAWTVNEGTNETIIVAVIDTGVAYMHPDLINNMWDGSECKDDANAYLGGCNHGYDYQDSDNTPLPTSSSHGTHVAGIIAAVKNNDLGVVGIAPNVKIMALKSGLTTTDNVKSINFAKYNGARIINASWGGTGNDLVLKDAISNFPGLFIAAAGNGSNYGSASVGDDHENEVHVYPSDFDLSNIVSVAATDSSDALAAFSDYGSVSVDVGAPGVNIYSTVAESYLLNETFDSLTPANIPSGWTSSGTHNYWGTYQLDSGTYWGVVLYGDVANIPYYDTEAVNSAVTSSTYDLSGENSPIIDFYTQCDTEYVADSDYMALDFSSDGTTFTEFMKWNEASIDSDTDPSSPVEKHFTNLSIPSQYHTSSFKFRFRWVTNGNGDTGGGDGCLVDDVKIRGDMDGSSGLYSYLSGTSMAAPYVAGLTGLIEGYNPDLIDSKVKDIIMTTGDSLASLSGKTTTGKRINAKSALDAAALLSISGTIKYYDNVKAVPGVTVVLSDGEGNQLATAVADSNGDYSFTDLTNGNDYEVEVESSDTGALEAVNVIDLISVRRHIAEASIFDSVYKVIAADVNRDLAVNVLDLIGIRRYIAEISALSSGAWKFYASDAGVDDSNYLTVGLKRTYANLEENKTGQDFKGIKMGDVNNSWSSE